MLDYEYHFEVFRRFVTSLAAGRHSGIDEIIYLRLLNTVVKNS